MFDLGWSELLLIGIVALIVVGPKDLPGLFRTAGQFMGKARGMAREFSRAMEAAADEAGVKEVQQTLKAAANPKGFGVEKLREATGTSKIKKGGATEALSKERAEAKERTLAATARAAEARRAREAANPDPGAEPMPAADAPVPDPDAPKPAGES